VLNAAGLTGRPNVDWCETHKVETIRANVVGCLTLADVCLSKNLHMTYYGTRVLLMLLMMFSLLPLASHLMPRGRRRRRHSRPAFRTL
jgi:hypothetical protein